PHTPCRRPASLKPAQNSRQECRNYVLWPKARNQVTSLPRQSRHFQLDIQKTSPAVALQHSRQRCRSIRPEQYRKVSEGMQVDGASLHPRIVKQDAVFVAGQANIEFKAVAAVLQGQIKSCIGIFVRIRSRPAMA